MSFHIGLKIACCILSAVLAAAIIARDPRMRVSWLMGMVPACAGIWALCEVIWNTRSDPQTAMIFLRLSSFGWLMVGPVFLDLFVELQGTRHARLRRLVPWAYRGSLAAIVLYCSTPWALQSVYATEWGWNPVFGPLFMPLFLTGIWPIVVVVANWNWIYPREGSRGERRVAVGVLATVLVVVTWASFNEVVMPLMGHDAPTQGSLLLTLGSLVIAWHLYRYGYSLMSAGAFAQEILAALGDGVALLFADGTVRVANPALERLAGVSRGELRGVFVGELLSGVDGRALEAGTPIEAQLRSRSGQGLPVSVTTCRLSGVGDGSASSWGDALLIRDVREVALLKERLVTSARLAAVGELSAGISQEVSRPVDRVAAHLDSLRNHWQSLEGHLQRDEERKRLVDVLVEGDELIDECLEGVGRVTAILQEVGGFARDRSGERAAVDLNRLVERALRVADLDSHPGIEIVSSLGELPEVVCAPNEIGQVLVNLLVNATQAVGEVGTIHVSTECESSGVVIRVEDDGCGFGEEVGERIFDPFYTTKSVGEGTGLGLAICLRIVGDHGGEIHFESQPGVGTDFSIRLPLEPTNVPRAIPGSR